MKGENPTAVAEVQSGIIVLGDHQYYRGYSLLLSRKHVLEVFDLPWDERQVFLLETALLAEAVRETFGAVKMNIEILGNKDPHLHTHIFPRHADDKDPNRPVWCTPKDVRQSNNALPSAEERTQDAGRLGASLVRLCNERGLSIRLLV